MMHVLPLAIRLPARPQEPPPVTLSGLEEFKFRAKADGNGGLACDNTYRGVGIHFDWGNTVTEVAPGKPAERAGVVAGDTLLNPWAQIDAAGNLTIEWIHEGVRRKFTGRAVEICRDRQRLDRRQHEDH